MVVGAKVCELIDDFLWFVCGLYVGILTSPLNSFAFYISSSYLRGNRILILDILLIHLLCKMLPLEIECLTIKNDECKKVLVKDNEMRINGNNII